MSKRKPNTQECVYYGRNLSTYICDIETNKGNVAIGSENDDQIYSGECLDEGDDMLSERVKIFITTESDEIEIDLEDIIRFSVINCKEMVLRIMAEER